MNHELTAEKMAIYRAAAQQRRQQRLEKLVQRREIGWEVARQAAELLKTQFGAIKVVVFGSMLSLERIHERSDLDLAVWGLNTREYYRAVGQLLSLESTIPVDLVEAEFAKPSLIAAIEQEGVPL